MRTAALAGLVGVMAVTSLVLVPDRALADRRQGFGSHSHRDRLHTVPPQRLFPRRFHHHHHGRSVPFVIGPSVIVTAPPAPVYAPPPVYYAPPPPVVYAPPPRDTVIEFSNGRYELRGDGITTPYRWVWIPNPPSAPPADAAPDVVPNTAPPAPPAPAEPTQRAELYRWTDESGVVHWTDRWDKVPEAYRSKVMKTAS